MENCVEKKLNKNNIKNIILKSNNNYECNHFVIEEI